MTYPYQDEVFCSLPYSKISLLVGHMNAGDTQLAHFAPTITKTSTRLVQSRAKMVQPQAKSTSA